MGVVIFTGGPVIIFLFLKCLFIFPVIIFNVIKHKFLEAVTYQNLPTREKEGCDDKKPTIISIKRRSAFNYSYGVELYTFLALFMNYLMIFTSQTQVVFCR